MSLTSEKHRAELERYGELLLQEAYRVDLVPAAGTVPYDTLVVNLHLAEKPERVWLVELSYLPGLEDELDDVSILQCYVTLSDHTAHENTAALERLIVKLNANLPLGSFGLLDNPSVLFFKHNALLPNDNPIAGTQIVHELVAMTGFLIGLFSDELIKLATGEKTSVL